jgi:hypothetical protein
MPIPPHPQPIHCRRFIAIITGQRITTTPSMYLHHHRLAITTTAIRLRHHLAITTTAIRLRHRLAIITTAIRIRHRITTRIPRRTSPVITMLVAVTTTITEFITLNRTMLAPLAIRRLILRTAIIPPAIITSRSRTPTTTTTVKTIAFIVAPTLHLRITTTLPVSTRATLPP